MQPLLPLHTSVPSRNSVGPETALRAHCCTGLGFHVETDLADAPRVLSIRTTALKQKEAETYAQVRPPAGANARAPVALNRIAAHLAWQQGRPPCTMPDW